MNINDCKRGFKTSDEIMRKIGEGNVGSCNDCNNFVYSQGLCSCKYISPDLMNESSKICESSNDQVYME